MPPLAVDTSTFSTALNEGRLLLQRCVTCARYREPTTPVCPGCGGRGASWEEALGAGTLFSWVRYHRAYLPAFESLIPYAVGLVELTEGPRIVGRLIGIPSPTIGMPVVVIYERWPDGVVVPAFGPPEEGD